MVARRAVRGERGAVSARASATRGSHPMRLRGSETRTVGAGQRGRGEYQEEGAAEKGDGGHLDVRVF